MSGNLTGSVADHIPDELLSAYSEGDLSEEQMAELQRHLTDCERCTAALDAVLETRSLLRGLSRAATPATFARHVERKLRRRSRGRFFGPQWNPGSRAYYLVAGVVIVILLALYLLSQVAFELRDARTGRTADELRQQPQETMTPTNDSDAGSQ